jgi:hypothetical protein
MHDTEGETIEDVRRQRDEAIAWIEDYKADHLAIVGGQCAGDERHCSCVPHLRNALDEARAEVSDLLAGADAVQFMLTQACRERDALGIQLAALRERLRLAMDATRKLKAFRDGITFKVDEDRGVHSLRSIAVDLERLWDESADALAALDAVPGDTLERP